MDATVNLLVLVVAIKAVLALAKPPVAEIVRVIAKGVLPHVQEAVIVLAGRLALAVVIAVAAQVARIHVAVVAKIAAQGHVQAVVPVWQRVVDGS